MNIPVGHRTAVAYSAIKSNHGRDRRNRWWLASLLSIAATIYWSPAHTQDYHLAPDDQISVSVYGEPELDLQNVRVGTSGTVSFPLLGEVHVAGLTTTELVSDLTSRFSRFLKNPNVTVSVTEYRLFYVNGEVEKTGGFRYRDGLTVQKAIALAGGFTDRASRKKIYIIREDDVENEHRVSLSDKVLPGDIITVNESFF